MGMGRAATSGFQNATNNVQNGMGGKGGAQPQGGFRGKGGAQQPQGGFGGKGAGQYQPQVQQPQGGFGGKGGQQQNPYAQQYYQPQFQPDTFNNPYAQGGFGQQMSGMGGKGGQLQQLAQQQQMQQGGMGGKGGQMPNVSHALPGQPPQMGGMGGKGRSQSNVPAYAQPYFARMLRGQPSGLAALQQPTATTQAVAPEQPYMGNYLQ